MADYIKMQNAGSVLSDLRLLNEMINSGEEFKDKNGYFSKKNIAKIAVASLIITSSGKIGEKDLFKYIDDTSICETNNPILQNTKLIMQNMRMLGLVSTDYNSEEYALTDMAYKVVEQYFVKHNYKLLRELFMNVNTTTEIYEHFCSHSFASYIGYSICYALSKLDYRIAVNDMPCLTTYSIEDIDSFVEDTIKLRKDNKFFTSSHAHYPRKNDGTPIKHANNLTRKINQLLRFCDIIEKDTKNIDGANYYVCTNNGKKYVDLIARKFRKFKFLSAHDFRKFKVNEQKEIIADGILNIYKRSGIEKGKDTNTIFSPFQMLPEITINWFLGKEIRKAPESSNHKTILINSRITGKQLRINEFFNQGTHCRTNKLKNDDNGIIQFINKKDDENVENIANELIALHQHENKEDYYPFIHSLLRIIGIECFGEVGRYDAFCYYKNHIIPCEIKSYSETPTYNIKGLRQAIENKIHSYSSDLDDDCNFSTFVIGHQSPKNNSNIFSLIESAYENWNIKVIACDALSLAKMCVNVIKNNKKIDLEILLTSYGIISE